MSNCMVWFFSQKFVPFDIFEDVLLEYGFTGSLIEDTGKHSLVDIKKNGSDLTQTQKDNISNAASQLMILKWL